jgi:uncharacterized protein (DUF1800 family)
VVNNYRVKFEIVGEIEQIEKIASGRDTASENAWSRAFSASARASLLFGCRMTLFWINHEAVHQTVRAMSR